MKKISWTYFTPCSCVSIVHFEQVKFRDALRTLSIIQDGAYRARSFVVRDLHSETKGSPWTLCSNRLADLEIAVRWMKWYRGVKEMPPPSHVYCDTWTFVKRKPRQKKKEVYFKNSEWLIMFFWFLSLLKIKKFSINFWNFLEFTQIKKTKRFQTWRHSSVASRQIHAQSQQLENAVKYCFYCWLWTGKCLLGKYLWNRSVFTIFTGFNFFNLKTWHLLSTTL